MIETTMGGYKFPDGTIQSTAFSAGQVVSSLNGLKGDVILSAESNIIITTSGNILTIEAVRNDKQQKQIKALKKLSTGSLTV